MAWVLYANWKASKKWSFTPRVELFSDEIEGAANNAGNFIFTGATKANDVKTYTLTSTYHQSENTDFRFELRNDQADENLWIKDDGSKEDSLTALSLSWLVRI